MSAGPAIISRAPRFGDSLSWQDRQTLRAVVRKVGRVYLGDKVVEDRWVDNLIDSLGPTAQAKMLRQAILANKEN